MAGVRAEEFAGPVNGDRHPWDDEAEVVIKGDHKKQFSAERTTNQWVLLGIKSGGIAIGMLAAGRYSPPIKIAGLLLMFPAIFCAAWGGIQYRRRTSNIESLSKDSLASFEDRFGTTVAVIALSLAVLANTVLGIHRYIGRLDGMDGNTHHVE